MANSFTEAQALQVVNSPAVAYLRRKGTSDSYVKSIFTTSFSFASSPEQFAQQFDDTGDSWEAIGNESAEMTFDTAYIFNLPYLEMISGGLMTRSTVSAGPTVTSNQVIAADWTDKALNVLNLVNADGDYMVADGEPAITSVTAIDSGVLAANDDYTIVPDGNSISGYSIVFNTAGTAEVETTESITIVYNSPAVLESEAIDFGGIKNYSPLEGYIETQNRGGEDIIISLHKAYWNANFAPSFGSENSPEAAASTFTFNIKLDTTRPVGSQLYRVQIVK